MLLCNAANLLIRTNKSITSPSPFTFRNTHTPHPIPSPLYKTTAAIPTATAIAIPASITISLAAPVNVAICGPVLEGVVVALASVFIASVVGTAIAVFSSSGVVVYVIRSPKNVSAVLGNGSAETGEALGKARREAAGARGLIEERSKGAGARTLGIVSLWGLIWERGVWIVPVNNVRDAIVEDVISERDARVVHPRRAVWQDSEDEIIALEGWDRDVTQRSREDDVIGDDVVLEHLLQSSLVSRRDNRADVLERVVGGHEDGVVGEIECVAVGAG